MATREQLYAALQRADAAGDTEAARRIAQALAGGSVQPQQAPAEPVDYAAKEAAAMPWNEALAVGVGRGFNDVGQGLKQLALQSMAQPGSTAPLGLQTIGALMGEKAAQVNPMAARAQEWAQSKLSEQQRQQSGQLEEYKKLSDAQPWAAGVGRVAGNIAAMPIPAAQAETLAGKAVAGATVGGLTGAAQFVPEGGSRAVNAAVGASLGAVLPGLLKGVSLTYGGVKTLAGRLKDLVPGMTNPARERLAAQLIRESAANSDNLAMAGKQPQFIPGTQQTLAEATNDAGIAGLQRTLASMDPRFNNELTNLAQANNTARVEAIRAGFGGADEASAQAIEAARNQATAPLLAAARKVKGVDIEPAVKLADRIIKSREGNKTVVGVLSEVRDLLKSPNMDQVQVLHNVRQEIGNILSGLSPSKEAGKAATRELLAIREALDKQIAKASPEFQKFLKQYAQMSKEAGRVRMGDELLGKSFAARDAAGNPILSPAQFARAANDLDRVAKAATGFRKETAQSLMTPEQRTLTEAMRADLDRLARSQTGGKAVGSNTVQNLMGAANVRGTVAGETVGAMAPGVMGMPLNLLNSARRHYGEKTVAIVQEMLLNPQRAQQLLSQYPAAQRQQVMSMIQNPTFQQFMSASMRGAPMGAGAAVSADGQQQ